MSDADPSDVRGTAGALRTREQRGLPQQHGEAVNESSHPRSYGQRDSVQRLTAKCPSHSDALALELPAARELAARSRELTRLLWANYPIVSRNAAPSGAPTLHWYFAKLYEIITYHELNRCSRLRYPGFTLRFACTFYGLYQDAVVSHVTTGQARRRTSLWQRYLQLVEEADQGPTGILSLVEILDRAARAHILGDMDEALAQTFKGYRGDYCPTIAYENLREDFFGTHQRQLFHAVTADFQAHLMVVTPTWIPIEQGQFLLALIQHAAGVMTGDALWEWRTTAWARGREMLD